MNLNHSDMQAELQKKQAAKRKQQTKKSRTQAAIIFFAAAMALAAQLYSGSSSSNYSERILDKAAVHYKDGEKLKALNLIEAEPNQFVPIKNGCEFIIAIFSEMDKVNLLENAATKCIDAGKAIGIAHEGYAKSLLLQGRTLEAIMMLEKETHRFKNPRIHGAIASLYLNQKDFEGVAKNLLLAVTYSQNRVGTWVERSLSTRDISDQKKFISDLVKIVTSKYENKNVKIPAPDFEAVTKLIKVAKTLGLDSQVRKLETRQG